MLQPSDDTHHYSPTNSFECYCFLNHAPDAYIHLCNVSQNSTSQTTKCWTDTYLKLNRQFCVHVVIGYFVVMVMSCGIWHVYICIWTMTYLMMHACKYWMSGLPWISRNYSLFLSTQHVFSIIIITIAITISCFKYIQLCTTGYIR